MRFALIAGAVVYVVATVPTIWYNLQSASLLFSPVLLLVIPYVTLGCRLLSPAKATLTQRIAFALIFLAMLNVLYLDVASEPIYAMWHHLS